MAQTIRNNQRMYLKPIEASDKFFLPDPSNYFGSVARRASSDSTSSKSSDSEPKANKAMWQHNFLLDQEKRMVDIAQTQLENQALDLLVNTYNGDVSAFQRGEFDKMQKGEGFYANMSRVQNANSIYRSNKLSAEMELAKWEGLAEKARTDEALNMVIEDDYNNPMRRGNDGKIYQLGKNENGALVYMAEDGTVKPKEEGDKFDYLTMQDYLQTVYFQSGYQDGVAVGPRNYKESYDMKQQAFMTEIKDILTAAAARTNESGGKQEFLVGRDQIPMDANAARSVADNWTFLKTVEQSGYSNVKNLMTAVDSIYSSLSPNAKRDLRQRLYQAQRSGVQMQSAPNIKGESKIESGQDLSMETFVYNLAIGRAASMFDQGSTRKESFNMLTDFNKDSNQGNAPKMTTWEMLNNPTFIDQQGELLDENWSFIVQDENNPEGYNKETMPVKAVTVNDPTLVAKINDVLAPRNSSGEIMPRPVEELGIKSGLGQNGQIIDLDGTGAVILGATGRFANMPFFRTKNGKLTEETEYTWQEDAEGNKFKDNRKIPYMEIKVKVKHVGIFRDNLKYYDLPGNNKIPNEIGYIPYAVGAAAGTYMHDLLFGVEEVSESMLENDKQRSNPNLTQGQLRRYDKPSRDYVKAELKGSYTGLANEDLVISMWVPQRTAATMLSGESLRTGTHENSATYKQVQSNLLLQKYATPSQK